MPEAELLFEINTKLDVLINQHSHLAGMVTDHETRIRGLEEAQHKDDERNTQVSGALADHETRLRASDRFRYALPIGAVSGVGAMLAGAAALITAIKP